MSLDGNIEKFINKQKFEECRIISNKFDISLCNLPNLTKIFVFEWTFSTVTQGLMECYISDLDYIMQMALHSLKKLNRTWQK